MSSRLTGPRQMHLMLFLVEIFETFIPSNASYLDGYCRAPKCNLRAKDLVFLPC